MANNRLLILPLEIIFKITNYVTIFDLDNMEKSGLFELNEQGISDVIQAAFQQPRHIICRDGRYHNDELLKKLIFRCGTGLRSLIVNNIGFVGFLNYACEKDNEFGRKLAALCPNIERFGEIDYQSAAFRQYIRNIENSKLVEINADYLTIDDLQLSFTPKLKYIKGLQLKGFINRMAALHELRPTFGESIEHITVHFFDFLAEKKTVHIMGRLITFFPNLETIKVSKDLFVNEFVYNREQINRSDFLYQIQLIRKYDFEDLPYINQEQGEKFDLSTIIKHRPGRFDPHVFDQLTNLKSLHLTGNKKMYDFCDYLSDTSFASLKLLDFTELKLDVQDLAKLETLLSNGRFIVRNNFNILSSVERAVMCNY